MAAMHRRRNSIQDPLTRGHPAACHAVMWHHGSPDNHGSTYRRHGSHGYPVSDVSTCMTTMAVMSVTSRHPWKPWLSCQDIPDNHGCHVSYVNTSMTTMAVMSVTSRHPWQPCLSCQWRQDIHDNHGRHVSDVKISKTAMTSYQWRHRTCDDHIQMSLADTAVMLVTTLYAAVITKTVLQTSPQPWLSRFESTCQSC